MDVHIIKILNINFPTIIFSLYLALSLYRFAFPSMLITIAMIVTGLIPFLLFFNNIFRLNKYICIIFILLLIYYIISCILLDRYEAMPRNILHLINCFLIALLVLSGKIKSWGVHFIFYALSLYFLTFILRGIPAHEVLDYSSWNGISMMIIISCISLYMVDFFICKNISLIPAILTFIFSFWGMGRSGILSSGILVFGILILKFKNLKYFKSLLNFKSLLVLAGLLFTMTALIFQLNEYIVNSFNSSIGILDRDTVDISTGRFEIWENYYSNLDLFRFIFGSNIFTDPWPNGEELEYNLHNSFLRLFSYSGSMGILVLVLMILALINFVHTNKLFFILLLVLICRGFTDVLFFFESWDFLPLFFIFYYVRNRNQFNINSKYYLKI